MSEIEQIDLGEVNQSMAIKPTKYFEEAKNETVKETVKREKSKSPNDKPKSAKKDETRRNTTRLGPISKI